VRAIESAFREVLDIDGDQEAGILPMKLSVAQETPEVVNA
jgi:hypothetical protein